MVTSSLRMLSSFFTSPAKTIPTSVVVLSFPNAAFLVRFCRQRLRSICVPPGFSSASCLAISFRYRLTCLSFMFRSLAISSLSKCPSFRAVRMVCILKVLVSLVILGCVVCIVLSWFLNVLFGTKYICLIHYLYSCLDREWCV